MLLLSFGVAVMAKPRVPTDEAATIIRENGMDPESYGVTFRTDDSIYLLCYRTRDEVLIRKGDRKW